MLSNEHSTGRDKAINQVLLDANGVADLRKTTVGAVRQTVNMSAFAPQRHQPLPEQMFVVPGKKDAGRY